MPHLESTHSAECRYLHPVGLLRHRLGQRVRVDALAKTERSMASVA